jgi:hypothetical protein
MKTLAERGGGEGSKILAAAVGDGGRRWRAGVKRLRRGGGGSALPVSARSAVHCLHTFLAGNKYSH